MSIVPARWNPFSRIEPRFSCMHEGCDSVTKELAYRETDLLLRCQQCGPHDGDCGHGLPKAHWCPSCHHLLDLQAAAAPATPFVGGAETGKTGLLAVTARVLEDRRALSQLGLFACDLTDPREYRRRVVHPLFADGVLPKKTKPGEHASLAMKLRSAEGEVTRVLRFSDVAGEVFEEAPVLAGAQATADRQVRAMQRASQLRARTAVFLLDPERTPDLEGQTELNLWKQVDDVLAATGGLTGTEVAVLGRFQRLATAFRALDVPRRVPSRIELESALAGSGLSGNIDQVFQRAREWAAAFAARAGLESFGRYAQYLEQFGVKHRVAIVVPKADTLGSLFDEYNLRVKRIQVEGGVLGPGGRFLAQAVSPRWRRALKQISECAEQLLPATVREAVRAYRHVFTEHAFFFVSALGRATEPLLQSIRPASSPEKDAAAADTWQMVGQRLVEGPEGRAPMPRNLWLPLIWALQE